jgi:tetratricopeptide (TPR) repeat protein
MLQESRIQRYAKEAIALAMQGRWEEAVAANRAILELSHEDVDAYNRLGRALMELGEYAAAKEAYERALELDPYNRIAKKNLNRLSYLVELSPPPMDRHKVVFDIFVEETGKAGVVHLVHLAPKAIVAQMAPGQQVSLQAEGQKLIVSSGHGEYLGEVEPKHGLRLAKLIMGGNQYIAAINSLGEDAVKVTIREAYQHPSQAGRLSFPPRRRAGFRSYVRESLLRPRLEEEEAEEVGEIAEKEGFTVAEFYDTSVHEEEPEDHELGEGNGDWDS